MKIQYPYVKLLLRSSFFFFLFSFFFTNHLVAQQRNNIVFESLGSEPDAITRWPVIGTSTSYGITKAAISGRDAMKFDLRKGDPVFAGGVRAEVNRRIDVAAGYPYEVWYGMSYFVPTDWVSDQPNLFDIVNQWHDEGGALKSPFDFSIDGTQWKWQIRYDGGGFNEGYLGAVDKGKWTDFVFHIKFVQAGNGLVEIWKDGAKLGNYTGPVGYSSATVPPFFKMGNYKWPWNPQDLACCGNTNSTNHVLYINQFRLGNAQATYNDVAPTQATVPANQPPVANAGSNKTITLPASSATLNGSASTDADGTITGYQWQQVSGPSTSALSSTTAANITVSNLQAGVYTYRLTVTDNNNATNAATVTVTVNAAANQAPVANAGSNKTITLPASSATLNGSASTDADGTITGYQWQQVSGPSASALSSTTAANITVSNLQAGVYTYRLTVTDNNNATNAATVTVTVNAAANQAPVANAGSNKTITLPASSATLNGSASTDADGTITGYQWQQVSGPSASALSSTTAANITVSNLQAGVYTYRLTVTDNDNATNAATVTVTVNAAANQAPVANAGSNKTITLPASSATLNGSASTDADGTITGYQWQQVSGPSASALSSTTAASITVSNLQAGVYTYRLTVTDNNNATNAATVTVTVNAAANQAPIANAGSNKTITLPASSATLNGSASTDADGTITGYQWQQVSGPSASALSSTTAANITVSNLQAGVYTYRLTVTDNDNATNAATVTVTVNAAANQAPVANAGSNKTITLPASSATLNGSASTDADGTITGYQWQQVSGPSASALSSTTAASITVSNLQAGVYTYRLTVTDNNNATNAATVTVTVNAAANQAPIANAGSNKTITLPASSATLNGSASTDADGTITGYQWQQVSGPSASALSSTTAANITVSNLQAGVYTYRLTVTDNDNATNAATVTVTVNAAANQAPVANAGSNKTITLPASSATLNGSASTDADGTITGYQWQQVSGPSASTLSSTTAASITVSNLLAGVYTYRLTVTDNDNATGTTTAIVTVSKAPNKAPVAHAGSNKKITLPTNSTTLSASASTDPDGTIASYQWRQVNGPSVSTLSSASAANITVSSLQSGVYTYGLTVYDNESATATTTVTVTVNNAANKVPIAVAGPDQVIVVTANSTALDASGSSDPDGVISSYEWQQISGPANTVFSSKTAKSINVSNLLAGDYVYKLTVKDNLNAIATDTVKVAVIDNFRNYGKEFALYPNPAQDIINVRLLNDKAGKSQIDIVDMSGRKVLPSVSVTKPAGPISVPVTVSQLKPGSYIIQVATFGYKKISANFLKL